MHLTASASLSLFFLPACWTQRPPTLLSLRLIFKLYDISLSLRCVREEFDDFDYFFRCSMFRDTPTRMAGLGRPFALFFFDLVIWWIGID
jgi:hypothetical protein